MSVNIQQSANVVSLFPIPVAMYKFGREFTEQELNFLLNQETYKNTGNTTSKNTYLLESKELKDLKEFAENCIENYLRTIYLVPQNTVMRITQSWANYSKKGDWHHAHYHPNSFYSGVFYISADADKDRIQFDRPLKPAFRISSEQFNLFNSDSWWIPVTAGTLILFPSLLEHRVPTVVSDKTRISIAFNTFPVGKLGSFEGLTELKL